MQKKSQNFDLQEAMRLANSPAGKQLMEMLQKTDQSKVAQATDRANAGDYAAALDTLKGLLDSQDVQKLLKQLGR